MAADATTSGQGPPPRDGGLVRTLVVSALNTDGKGTERVKATFASRFAKEDEEPGLSKTAISGILQFARVRPLCSCCLFILLIPRTRSHLRLSELKELGQL
jgi:hypothetical protein